MLLAVPEADEGDNNCGPIVKEAVTNLQIEDITFGPIVKKTAINLKNADNTSRSPHIYVSFGC